MRRGLLSCSGSKIQRSPLLSASVSYLFPKLTERARMVEAFCATWKLTDSQNFDEYMKALGR